MTQPTQPLNEQPSALADDNHLISSAMIAALPEPEAVHRVGEGMLAYLSPGIAFSHERSSYIFAKVDEEPVTDGNGKTYRIVYGWSPQQLRTALLSALKTPDPQVAVLREALGRAHGVLRDYITASGEMDDDDRELLATITTALNETRHD